MTDLHTSTPLHVPKVRQREEEPEEQEEEEGTRSMQPCGVSTAWSAARQLQSTSLPSMTAAAHPLLQQQIGFHLRYFDNDLQSVA
jgi:hypothetical protein